MMSTLAYSSCSRVLVLTPSGATRWVAELWEASDIPDVRLGQMCKEGVYVTSLFIVVIQVLSVRWGRMSPEILNFLLLEIRHDSQSNELAEKCNYGDNSAAFPSPLKGQWHSFSDWDVVMSQFENFCSMVFSTLQIIWLDGPSVSASADPDANLGKSLKWGSFHSA